VVRSWPVGKASFTRHRSSNLRWPIYQAQRGSIFALALSPDERYAAVAGWGIYTSLVAVIDRQTGTLTHVLASSPRDAVNWKVAFAPSGKQLIYGTDDGSIFRWDFQAGATQPVELKGPGEESPCHIRLLQFLDPQRFLAVDREGRVWLGRLSGGVKEISALRWPGLKRTDIFRAALSPDLRSLAAITRNTREAGVQASQATRTVALYPLRITPDAVRLGKQHLLPVPQPAAREARIHSTHSLAFDAAGQRLAVGVRIHPRQDGGFFKEIGGRVHVFDDPWAETPTPRATFDLSNRPDCLAFRPGVSDQLATAGGDDHEVRLWDLRNPREPLDEIRTPGSSLWGVALSRDARYLGFQEHRRDDPPHPNQWGDGRWRVLELLAGPLARGPEKDTPAPRKLSSAPRDFDPVLPLTQQDGWKVRTTNDLAVWEVVDGKGDATRLEQTDNLYDPNVNQLPCCYTFLPRLPGKPVRLAVGHRWGISIYECRPGRVRLDRMLVGHEGDVMSVAPSADGRLLVSASRDQTVACWSLEDWPSQPVLGASFQVQNGKVVVKQVDPGSPAWELGLQDGDEITVCVISDDYFVYNASGKRLKALGITADEPERPATLVETVEQLARAQSNREIIFYWKTSDPAGKVAVRHGKIKVYQRPLWRMFPTRPDPRAGRSGSEFVIWRWMDFYYDTNSAHADEYLGWHLNTGNGLGTPEFLPLERCRVRFQRPDRIWPAIVKSFYNPDRVVFGNIEPPRVELKVVQGGREVAGPVDLTDADLELRLIVRPHSRDDEQTIRSVALWLDDYRYDSDKIALDRSGQLDVALELPGSILRRGLNRLTLQAVNKAGNRGQAEVRVRYASRKPVVQGKLVGLCVGINAYRAVRNQGLNFADLRCSETDAEAIARVLREHKHSKLFEDADVQLLQGPQVTTEAIRGWLKKLDAKGLRRDDQLVLFLSGHGHTGRDAVGAYVPNSFAYVCADSDPKRADTFLRSRDLAEDLARLPCRKLILFDACHSGGVAGNPIRALTASGIPLVVLSACQPDESAHEPENERDGKHGLFTEALLRSVDGVVPRKEARTVAVTGEDLIRTVQQGVRKRLEELDPGLRQTPVFYPETLLQLQLLCRPGR
jgi:WD40 repeat protein